LPFVASTCYDQPIYQIWSVYLHPLRIYECRKWGGLGYWSKITDL